MSFTAERTQLLTGAQALFIDGGTEGEVAQAELDEHGTYLHVMNSKENGTFVRMGDSNGRHLPREEATALRDYLNEVLGS